MNLSASLPVRARQSGRSRTAAPRRTRRSTRSRRTRSPSSRAPTTSSRICRSRRTACSSACTTSRSSARPTSRRCSPIAPGWTGRQKTWPVSDFTLAEIKRLDAGSWFEPEFKRSACRPGRKRSISFAARPGLVSRNEGPEVYGSRGFDMETLVLAQLAKNNARRPAADPKTPVIIQSFSADSLQKMARPGTKVPLDVPHQRRRRDARAWLSDEGLEDGEDVRDRNRARRRACCWPTPRSRSGRTRWASPSRRTRSARRPPAGKTVRRRWSTSSTRSAWTRSSPTTRTSSRGADRSPLAAYEWRRALTGSTREARRAGITTAASATPVNVAAATT